MHLQITLESKRNVTYFWFFVKTNVLVFIFYGWYRFSARVSRHTIMSRVKCDYSSLEIENVTQIESSLLQVMYRQVILFPTFSRRDLADREYNFYFC